jgi:SAM-dependent methyltransferase
VLDAGSGEGGWVRRLAEAPTVTSLIAVDLIDAGAGSVAGVDLRLANLSVDPLPVPDSSIDFVTALEVIEHLANPRHFISEARRALKPGGKLLVSTPCNDSLTARLSLLFRGYYPAFADHSYHACGHISPITELDLRRMAGESGFPDIKFHYPPSGRMPRLKYQWPAMLKGRLWSDVLFAVLTK